MKMETCANKAARAMCASVLAAGLMIPSGVALANTSVANSQVTITGLQSGDTVSAYKIAGVDINDDNTLNYTFVEGLPADYDSVEELSKIGSDGYDYVKGSDMQNAAAKIANAIVKNGTDKTATAADGSTQATLNLPSGYYLVRVTSTSGNTKVYQNMIVDVTPQADGTAYKAHDNVTADVKSTDVTVTKKVGENYTDKTDAYQVGDEVPFQITTAIPSYPAGSPNATFVISDTPTAGLSIEKDTITVSAGEATKGTDYTVTTTDSGYTVTFTRDFILKNPGVPVTVTYKAKLTKDAFSKADGTVTGNTATVKFNPNPYTDTTVTPEDKTTVQTYGYVFDKTGKDNVALAGAVFTLCDTNGNPVKDENGNEITSTSTIVDGKAYVYFSGLKSGSYKAKETKVPAGYTAVSDIEFSVSSDDAKADNPATDVKENNFKVNASSVQDPEASKLPVTGGAGTMAVTVAGVAFIGGAAYLIVRSRRKGEDQQ